MANYHKNIEESNISIIPDQREYNIGIYGRRHARYLKEHKKIFYYNLLTSGDLQAYLAEINEQSIARRDKLIHDMQIAENVNEELKSKEIVSWVQGMNNIRNRVDEIIGHQLLFR